MKKSLVHRRKQRAGEGVRRPARKMIDPKAGRNANPNRDKEKRGRIGNCNYGPQLTFGFEAISNRNKRKRRVGQLPFPKASWAKRKMTPAPEASLLAQFPSSEFADPTPLIFSSSCWHLLSKRPKFRSLSDAEIWLFDRLYRENINRVRAVIRRAGLIADSEDVAHEAFLRAMQCYRPDKGHFWGLLRLILRWQMANYFREEMKRGFQPMPDDFDCMDEAAEDRAKVSELAELLEQAASILKPEERELLDLFYVHGYSIEEIASLLL